MGKIFILFFVYKVQIVIIAHIVIIGDLENLSHNT